MSKVRDLPPVSGSIIWARQVSTTAVHGYIVDSLINCVTLYFLQGQSKSEGDNFVGICITNGTLLDFWGGRNLSWPCIRLLLVIKKMLLYFKEKRDEICTTSFKMRAIIPTCVLKNKTSYTNTMIYFFLF